MHRKLVAKNSEYEQISREKSSGIVEYSLKCRTLCSAQCTAHTQMEISVEIFLDGKNEQIAYSEQAK